MQRKKRKKGILLCILCMIAAVLCNGKPRGTTFGEGDTQLLAATTRAVTSQSELEKALYEPGELIIALKKNIAVSRMLQVRGKKTILGGSYRIRRKVSSQGIYRGTLLYMQGESLKLTNVTLNGSGKNQAHDGNVNGRLIETSSGTITLGQGVKLTQNYNLTSFTDGGGGITVHSGGKLIMETGSEISDNLSITGGSGVRVDAGGKFTMKGGSIHDNAVIGQRGDTGFDGRGGGIHNRGNVSLQGGELAGNIATGYKQGTAQYGGFGGAIYNMGVLSVEGAVLHNNEASFAGGGIYTNSDSQVTMKSGKIIENRSVGQRGGGIYLSAAAKAIIAGGTIRGNVAEDGTQIFLSSTATGGLQVDGGSISGDKSTIFNNGSNVRISGGSIRSTHCAVRNKGLCQVRGGEIYGDTYGIYQGDGSLLVSGTVNINECYLCQGQLMNADGKLTSSSRCELWPETYEEGRKLVAITSGQKEEDVLEHFSLKKKKRYLLECGDKGLYLGRERYTVCFEANGGTGTMSNQKMYVDEETWLTPNGFWREGYGFVGWSRKETSVKTKEDIEFQDKQRVKNLGVHGSSISLFALWVKKPYMENQTEVLSFYEDEQVTREILLHGMKATDEIDGDISSRIQIQQITRPDGNKQGMSQYLPTDKTAMGKGEIRFRVTNSFGIGTEFIQEYEVVPNRPPEVTAPDRYYFTGEFEAQTQEEEKASMMEQLILEDDIEERSQLQNQCQLEVTNVSLIRPGEYQAEVTVRDQYGHRYYMPEGTQCRYGTGKVTTKVFTVVVVDRLNSLSPEGKGYVRFVSSDSEPDNEPDSEPDSELDSELDDDAGEQIWVIRGEDKRQIKAFVLERENPFTRETNQLFYEQFKHLRKK